MRRTFILFLCMSWCIFLHPNLHAQSSEETDTTSLEEYNDTAEEEDTSAADTSILRHISESTWKKIEKDSSFIYHREKEKKKVKKAIKNIDSPAINLAAIFGSVFFKVILFLIVGLILFGVIHHLFLSGEYNFFKQRKKKIEDSKVDYEHVEEFSKWDKALQQALAAHDNRLAVRIRYLQTLQALNKGGLINYQLDKTNWEYVRELAGSSHGTGFSKLTMYFDYVWYGSFAVNDDQFKSIESQFLSFQQSIQ